MKLNFTILKWIGLKKITLLTVLLTAGIFEVQCQCPTAPTLSFRNNFDILQFQINYPLCQNYTGSIDIRDDATGILSLSVTSLSGLFNLRTVGSLNIHDASITDLTGLNNLTTVTTSFDIQNNLSLLSLNGLPNLTSVGSYFTISGNTNLINIAALNNWQSISSNYLTISDNPNLLGLFGLTKVQSIYKISIDNNDKITDLMGLSLTSCDELDIRNNDKLTALTGLNNPTSRVVNVVNNKILPSLANMGNVASGGYVLLADLPELTNISALSPVTNLGGLSIINNNKLTSLATFNNLTSTGELLIASNNMLTSLTGLNNVNTARSILIQDNINLNSISGLSALTSVGIPSSAAPGASIEINNNDALTNLTGLNNISIIRGGLTIQNNAVLSNLNALTGLTTLHGSLNIYNNALLSNISGLNNISVLGNPFTPAGVPCINNNQVYIGSNPALTSLAGIVNMNLSQVCNLWLENNSNLSFCRAANICNYLSLSRNAYISGNLTTCTDLVAVNTACSAPLPIELLSFTAQNRGEGNLLNWQTANEINTSHFDIERSDDGIKFNKIGELKAQNKAANYTYLDKAPFGGWGVYYHLTVNDLDGKTNVSKIISIEKNSDKNIKITRNTEGSILIETNAQLELITVTNMLGQTVKLIKEKQFLINDLNAGIYIISVKTDKGFLSQKIFKE